MYFESLNSSLGPGPVVAEERSVEEVAADEDAADRGPLNSPNSTKQEREAGYGRDDQTRIGFAGNSSRIIADGELDEVPPPAYEDVMEQTGRKKR